ncbi:AraC family transcriptional regulator [Paenibacillus koleovorans]|uniref:AraC family transcriptional regulator n=1 Tax=Paenibacillus koleovorans TaxID=121608 RepID=UPI000FDB4AF4|nr:AraC family transcriptional regulator [Paenibacillus koleovorans]
MPFSNNVLLDRHFLLKYRDLSTNKESFAEYYHYHRGIELLFVYQGKGQLVLNRKVTPLESGSIFFIQPFQLHRVHFDVSEDCPYERSVIKFEPTYFYPLLKQYPTVLRFFERMWKDELSEQVLRMESDRTYIYSLLERLYRRVGDSREKRGGSELAEAAAVLLLPILDYLQSLEGAIEERTSGVPRAEHHAEKIMHWVEEHYTEPFELEQVARELHLSKHHVSHLFRSETGSSLTEYVIARRIRQACWLLKTDDASIEQIGARVGFPHFSYFCRVFKKSTGMTPAQYRNYASI